MQGTAKVNDSYLDSSRYSTVNKQHVLCQEVGHTFGLGHTSEDGTDDDTCMDYADAFDKPHTPAQATSASSSMPPEQRSEPSPPVAG